MTDPTRDTYQRRAMRAPYRDDETATWADACKVYACTKPAQQPAPMCLDHLLDAWRFIEANRHLRPTGARSTAEASRAVERPTMVSVVYYVRRPFKRIKIGTTTNLFVRAQSLGASWPDDVLAVEWGGRDVESQRHVQFSELRRYNGAGSCEEFADSPELQAHIAAIRAEMGDPDGVWQQQIDKNRALGFLPATR